MNTFTCSICQETKEVHADGGTGYAVNDKDEKICYDCCAIQDKDYMIKEGKITLYLTIDKEYNRNLPNKFFSGHVSNWPNSLNFSCNKINMSNHNIAGVRYDTWFAFNNHYWHGYTIGDNSQICHCKQTKELVK